MYSGLNEEIIAKILEHGNLYEVGGAVRDRLLHPEIEPKDIDYLVTGVPLNDLVTILSPFGRVDLVGKSFGVIKFTPSQRFTGGGESVTYDIALPRKEISTGKGHRDFQVEFSAEGGSASGGDHRISVEEDLGRRDFTINAMALSLMRNAECGMRRADMLIDPFGGRQDLEERIIRLVNPNAFEEDPLRMLRAVQFAARFEFSIEEKTFKQMKSQASLIQSISPERIQEELNKMLLKANRPSIGFWLMKESGLLKEILPELQEGVGISQPGGYHRYDVFEHSIIMTDESPKDLVLRLAALLHDVAKPRTKVLTLEGATFYGHERQGVEMAKSVLQRLRYSNEVTEKVLILVKKHMFSVPETDKGLRRLIRRVGEEGIFQLLELRRADVKAQGMGGSLEYIDTFEKIIREELAKKPPLSVKDLAINGYDVMQEFNLPSGPIIGKILNHLLAKVLENPKLNNKEELFKAARKFVKR